MTTKRQDTLILPQSSAGTLLVPGEVVSARTWHRRGVEGTCGRLFTCPLSRQIHLVLCSLSPHGGNECPGLFQGLQRCQKAPMRTGQEGITLEVSAFLSPLVRSMEHHEVESELSDEEH